MIIYGGDGTGITMARVGAIPLQEHCTVGLLVCLLTPGSTRQLAGRKLRAKSWKASFLSIYSRLKSSGAEEL